MKEKMPQQNYMLFKLNIKQILSIMIRINFANTNSVVNEL